MWLVFLDFGTKYLATEKNVDKGHVKHAKTN